MSGIKGFITRIPGIGPLLALTTFYALNGGDAVGGLVIDEASPLVVAVMAAAFGTILLVLVTERAALVRRGRRARLREVGMNALINRMAVSNTFITPLTLLALDRLEALGTVIAITWLGPLTVATWQLLTDKPRRYSSLLWVLLAAAGVAGMTRPWEGAADPWGILLALGAAVCYGNFILVYNRMSRINKESVNVAIAASMMRSTSVMLVGASIALLSLGAFDQVVPGITPGPDWLSWRLIGLTCLAGVLTGFIAQIAQNAIFGWRLFNKEGTFTVLTALEPVVALTLGLWVLGYEPTWLDAISTTMVTVAGIGCYLQLEVRDRKRAKHDT